MRKVKILVDALLVMTLIFESIPAKTFSVDAHYWVGLVFGALLFVHLALNANAIKKGVAAIRAKRAKTEFVITYLVNLLLCIAWIGTIYSGLWLSKAEAWHLPKEPLFTIHYAFAISGVLLVAVHVVQHWKYIRSYFGA
jgi:hypothetical protein